MGVSFYNRSEGPFTNTMNVESPTKYRSTISDLRQIQRQEESKESESGPSATFVHHSLPILIRQTTDPLRQPKAKQFRYPIHLTPVTRSRIRGMTEYGKLALLTPPTKLFNTDLGLTPRMLRSLRETKLPSDCITTIYAFMTFKDISIASGTNSRWYGACSQQLFQREASRRWLQYFMDNGMGQTVPCTLRSSGWRQRAVYREHIGVLLTAQKRPDDQIKVAEQICLNMPPDDTVFQLEALRWLAELFDGFVAAASANNFPVPALSQPFVRQLERLLQKFKTNEIVIQIITKAVGVLAHNERNREKMSHNITGYLVDGLTGMSRHSETLCCVLWALVIVCRPIGGIEGEALSSFADENFANVNVVHDLDGLNALLATLRVHAATPDVLAKAFWLVVNLSLVESVKRWMIDHDVITSILHAMRDFPDHKDMQYRACFALINMGIRREAKQQIREGGGVMLLLAAMRRWQDCPLLQKCCCNVIRSLMVGDVYGVSRTITQQGGIEVLNGILERFGDEQDDLHRLARQTLYFLENW